MSGVDFSEVLGMEGAEGARKEEESSGKRLKLYSINHCFLRGSSTIALGAPANRRAAL